MHGYSSRLPLSRSIGHKKSNWYAMRARGHWIISFACSACWLLMCAELLFTWNLCRSVVYELREWVFTFDFFFLMWNPFCAGSVTTIVSKFNVKCVQFSVATWTSHSLANDSGLIHKKNPITIYIRREFRLHRNDVAFDWIWYVGAHQRLRNATRISHISMADRMQIFFSHLEI